MSNPIAIVDIILQVQCPECSHDFDALRHDDDMEILHTIFRNNSDDKPNVICPKCLSEFYVDLEY